MALAYPPVKININYLVDLFNPMACDSDFVDERRVGFVTASLPFTSGLSTFEEGVERILLTGVPALGVTSVAETERLPPLGVTLGVTSDDLRSDIFGGLPTLFGNSDTMGEAAWTDERRVILEGVFAADLVGDIVLIGDVAASSSISETLSFGFSGIGDNWGTTASALFPRLPGVRGRGDAAGRGEDDSSRRISVRDDLRAGVVTLFAGSLPLSISEAISAVDFRRPRVVGEGWLTEERRVRRLWKQKT